MKMNLLILLTLAFTVSCATSSPESSAVNGAEPVTEADGCNSPLGHIAEGGTATGYSRVLAHGGATCQRGELTCANGQWSGAFIYPTCTQL